MSNGGHTTVTVAAGETVSTVLKLPARTAFVALHFPSTFTGTKISFLASHELDGTYEPVQLDGTLIEVTVAASTWAALPAATLAALMSLLYVTIKTATAQESTCSIRVSVKG